MYKNSALFFAFFFLGFIAFSQKKNEIKFVRYKLDNGLQVILHQDNTTPIVAVSIMYHVGSKNENPNRTGFAHFFEHLLFEGSENIARGEFSKIVENAGGTLNANTSSDRTYYYEILPSNQLELGLWLESERLMHAKVEKEGIETQRQVVKEEKRMRVDNQPYGSVFAEVMKRAYTVHPYNWVPIGSMEHLDAAAEEDYVNFYKTYYVPNNAILSIAGDINIENAKKLIQAYFGPIPKGGEVPRPSIVEPEKTAEVRDVVYDNIQLPAVIQAYHIPAMGTKDAYAVEMLSTLLANGQSSRLYKSLVDEQQKALYAANFPMNLEQPGLMLNMAICNMGVTPEDLEASLNAEVEKVKNELISDLEFQKLKNQIENDFVSGNSTMAGIAEALANYQMYYGDANLINTEIERYNLVTKEDIQQVAKKYLTEKNRVVLYYLPHPAN
ncbi:MAG: insulinase family protein [Bacteroidetes bacterium]|nr:insulinase family protein [Bacteroidota bacterium]MCL4817196.1 insulinase family protein [Flavobacteriales bacterium]WKZ74062.1 MAG: pitrilysin family protein [Vicingaceae bacterium]NOG95849.1 insulinase family protein [Bacteroidota bacterium]CAG0948257.1 zinc protease [Flavobacteriales bacterium]